MAHILVVEDDADISRLLCRILSKGGYEAVPAYSGTEAKLRLEMSDPFGPDASGSERREDHILREG